MKRVFCWFVLFLAACLVGDLAKNAEAYRQGFRPTFTAPGVPCAGSTITTACDFATGRNSVADLKKLVHPGSVGGPFCGISSSAVAIGTGSKSFTIIGGQPFAVSSSAPFEVGGWAKLQSQADSANYLWGTVTAWNGTTLTINVPTGANACGVGVPCSGGSGTPSDWCLGVNIPNGGSFDAAQGIRISNVTVTDWDMRGGAINWYVQGGTSNVTFTQNVIDCAASTYYGTGPFFGKRANNATFTFTRNSVDCTGATPSYTLLGHNLVEAQYNYVLNWPGDFYLPGDSGDIDTIAAPLNVQFNYVQSSAAGTTGHADVMQIVRATGRPSFNVDHNVFIMPTAPPAGSGGLTAPIIFTANAAANWAVPTFINNNILRGGSYNMYFFIDLPFVNEGAITVGENMYVGDAQNGALYNGARVMPNLTISGLKNFRTGLPQSFQYNNGTTTTTVFSIPP